MVEYSEVQEHAPENITLLCPTHHQEKTSHRLPLARVRAHNADPYALKHPKKSGHSLTYFYGETFTFAIGTVLFTARSVYGNASPGALIVDGAPVLSGRLVNGEILIRAVIRDVDNRPALIIRDNEMRVASDAWDVTLEGAHLRIWWAQRHLGIDILFTQEGLHIVRGDFYANGYRFSVGYDRIFRAGRSEFDHCTLPGVALCAGTGADAPGCALIIGEEERYKPVGTGVFFPAE